MRNRVIGYSDRSYANYRSDALKALEDAREEQKELVLEEAGLLEMMHASAKDSIEEPPQKRAADLDTNLDEVFDDLEDAEKKEERE